MARKYSRKASVDVERAMKKRKAGTLRLADGRTLTSAEFLRQELQRLEKH